MFIRKQAVQNTSAEQISNPKERKACRAYKLSFIVFPVHWQIGPNPVISNIFLQIRRIIQKTAQEKVANPKKRKEPPHRPNYASLV